MFENRDKGTETHSSGMFSLSVVLYSITLSQSPSIISSSMTGEQEPSYSMSFSSSDLKGKVKVSDLDMFCQT